MRKPRHLGERLCTIYNLCAISGFVVFLAIMGINIGVISQEIYTKTIYGLLSNGMCKKTKGNKSQF